jgi:hypothetical protein
MRQERHFQLVTKESTTIAFCVNRCDAFGVLTIGVSMSFTSVAAKEFFKSDLIYDGDATMTEFSARQLAQEYAGKAIAASVLAAFPDIQAKYEAAKHGTVQTGKDGSQMKSMLSLDFGCDLLVKYPNGDLELFVWEKDAASAENYRITDFYIIPVRPEMPSFLQEELSATLASSNGTYSELLTFAKQALDYSVPNSIAGDTPSTIQDILARLQARGVRGNASGFAAQAIRIIESDHGLSARAMLKEYDHDIGIVDRLGNSFDLSGPAGHELAEYRTLLLNGAIHDMHGSVLAHQFETSIIGKIGDVLEIADTGRHLRLGQGTALAHGDTDQIVSVEDCSNRIVYIHDNIDRFEQNVFVTVVNMENDLPKGVDVYISNSWSRDFLETNGLDEDDVLDREMFDWLMDYVRHEKGKLGQDVLVSLLAKGCKPPEGLVFSYDISSKSLDVYPQAKATGYLAYAPFMIDRDLEVLRAVKNENVSEDGVEFQTRDISYGSSADVKGLEVSKYLRRHGLLASRSPSP